MCRGLGANRAGKTTSVRLLTGLVRPHRGVAQVAGVDVVESSLEAKRRIGLVPGEPQLFDEIMAREFLSFVGEFSGMPREEARRRLGELLEMFDFEDVADELVGVDCEL